MQTAESSCTSIRSYCSCVNNKCGGKGEERPNWLCDTESGSGGVGARGSGVEEGVDIAEGVDVAKGLNVRIGVDEVVAVAVGADGISVAF